MSSYLSVVKLYSKNFFRNPSSSKRKYSQSIIVAIAMFPLVVLVCVMLAIISPSARNQGILAELITCVMAASQVMCLFFAIQGILSKLYFAEDNAFLSSLPISPVKVYFAKLSVIYLSELSVSCYVLLPSLYTIGIAANVGAAYGSICYYFLVPLLVLLSPIFALSVASILSLPLMWITKFFKRRAVMGTIVSLLLFGLLFTAYYLLIPNLGNVGENAEISNKAAQIIKSVGTLMYPIKTCVLTALGIDAGMNFGISAAIIVGLVAIIVLLTKLFYSKAVSAQLESKSNAISKKAGMKSKNMILSMAVRDFKSLSRYPGLALSSFLNIIVAPIMICVMFYTMEDNIASLIPATNGMPVNAELVNVGMMLLYSLMLNAGLNITASQSFSRDGMQYAIVKHLPISARQVLISKLLLANAVSFVGILVLFVISLAVLKLSWYSALLFVVIMAIISVGINAFGVYTDLKKPNLDWKDTSEFKSNNMYVMLSMLICVVIGIVMVVLACTFAATDPILTRTGSETLFWGIAIILSAGITMGLGFILLRKGEALYEKLGEAQPAVPRVSKSSLGRRNNKGGFLN